MDSPTSSLEDSCRDAAPSSSVMEDDVTSLQQWRHGTLLQPPNNRHHHYHHPCSMTESHCSPLRCGGGDDDAGYGIGNDGELRDDGKVKIMSRSLIHPSPYGGGPSVPRTSNNIDDDVDASPSPPSASPMENRFFPGSSPPPTITTTQRRHPPLAGAAAAAFRGRISPPSSSYPVATTPSSYHDANHHHHHHQQQQQRQQQQQLQQRDPQLKAYRFETPSYVYGIVTPSATEVKAAAGCTCKKSRCLKLYCQCFSLSTTCGPKCKCGDCLNSTEHADSIDNARKNILVRNPAAFDSKATVRARSSWMPSPTSPESSLNTSTSTGGSSHPSPPALLYHPHLPPTNFAKEESDKSTYYIKSGCKCRRSFCLKKYCECYQKSDHCGLNCKCTNCKNSPPPPPHQNRPPGGLRYRDERVRLCHSSESSNDVPRVHRRVLATTSAAAQVGKAFHRTESSNGELCMHQRALSTTSAAAAAAADVTAYEHRRHPPQAHSHHPHSNVMVGGDGRTVAKYFRPQPHDPPQQESSISNTTTAPRWSSMNNDREPADRMTIMAAVAMTELFSSLLPRTATTTCEEDREGAARTTPTTQLTASLAATEIDQRKRKSATAAEEASPNKRQSPDSPSMEADDVEVRQLAADVVVTPSFMSVESRNPSPESTYRPFSHYPPPSRFPWSTAQPPYYYGQQQQQQQQQFPYERYPRMSPPTMMRGSPPAYHRPSSFSLPNTTYLSPPNHRTTAPSTNSYEEFTRNFGLPKSLSFRKICSRCGKTRGEHGESGFGNKCVYQDCGKCGAGFHWHELAGQSMGVLCQLKVSEGAIPGAAAAYERSIRELAVRADLHRALQRRRQHVSTETTMEGRTATTATTTFPSSSKYDPKTSSSNPFSLGATVQ